MALLIQNRRFPFWSFSKSPSSAQNLEVFSDASEMFVSTKSKMMMLPNNDNEEQHLLFHGSSSVEPLWSTLYLPQLYSVPIPNAAYGGITASRLTMHMLGLSDNGKFTIFSKSY